MKIKKTIILLTMVIFLLSLANAYASEIDDSLASEDASQIEVSSTVEGTLQASETLEQTDDNGAELKTIDEDELSSSGDFGELQKLIDDASDKSTINLERNYTYTTGTDNITEGIIINKNLTINGNGFAIDAQGRSRIFNISSGNNVVLNNIIFTNGYAKGYGGAILAEGNVNIVGSTFTNNTAAGVDGYGGAVFFNANGTVSNSNFIGNNAKYIGALFFYPGFFGNVTDCNFTANNASLCGAAMMETGNVENCNFVNNTADNLAGGLFIMGLGNVNNCNFIGNAVVDSAGAMGMVSGNISNCYFTNNTADRGGALVMASANVTDCIFTENNATLGGAIYIDDYFSDSKINSIFINNTATKGGAIYVETESTNNNISSLFYDNKALQSGGAIFFHNLTENNSFESNFVGNIAVYGGGIFFSRKTNANRFNGDFIDNTALSCGGAMFFHNTTDGNNFTGEFISNHALGPIDSGNGNGGAITFKDTSSNSIFNCNFTDNNASLNGGAVNYRVTPYNITFNANFNNNTSPTGGAVNFFETFENVVFNGEFIGNSADYGGAIATVDGIIKDVSFKDNHAEDDGGAVYFAGSGEVINCNFTDNSARYGGAVYFIGNGEVINCNFANNTANRSGGAIWMFSGNVTVCNFTDNAATRDGGAIKTYSCNVTNCNFDNNAATRNGGAVFFKENGTVENCNFKANTAQADGGAIYFNGTGEVSNCIFTNNEAVAEYDGGGAISMISGNVAGSVFKANKASGVGSMGGAVLIENSGNVTNCRFEDNFAEFGGAVSSDRTVNVADCNFTANRASVEGGAFYTGSCNIENSNFTNNIASNGRYSGDGGAVYINGNATVVNCDFLGNEASSGPAIYFWNLNKESKHVRSISHSTFLNNKANMDSIAPFTLTVNGTNIEIAFHGNNNLFNAILSRLKGDVNVTNVTYWGASGIENTGDSTIVSVMLYTQAGQNVTVRGVVDGVEVNVTKVTDAEGKIVLENVGDYNIIVSHDEDSYYASAKILFTNRQLSLNVTDITTTSKTVNITAESEILSELMPGEVVFRVDGKFIYADYAGNGTWWAMHTFDDFGTYKVSASFDGKYNVSIRNGTVTVNKLKTVITGSAITATYNVNKYLVITLKDSTGKALSGVKVTVNLNGVKTYTTDKNGQIKVSTKGLAPKKYTAKVLFNGDAVYDKSTKDIKVTVKKATPKLTAKKKTFKRSVKVKKYSIVLKNNVGKAIKKAKVTIKIGKKTFKAKTNSKGKATFKIKKLTKKGTYKAKVSFKGNKYYNKVTKKVKIRIK